MWYDDRPPPSDRKAALRKVFELARIPLGMMDLEEAAEWARWLDAVEHGTPFVPDATKGPRRCSACGTYGHKRTTCPAVKVMVEPR